MMATTIVGESNMLQYLPFVGKVIDKIFPDPIKAGEAKLEMMKMEQQGEFKEIDASLARDVEQAAINKIEAGSDSLFKSGWRPFIGWTCGVGFAYAVLIHPILTWVATIKGIETLPPNLSTDVLLPVMLGLLGLGGMRSYEKLKGLTKR